MDPKNIIKGILWLAALGLVILLATRIVGRVGAKAVSNSPI